MADQSPFSPTMQAQIEQLLQQQTDRSARTTPIHQAAMAMASRMAPGYAQSAMTGAPSSVVPRTSGSLTPSVSSSGGPGVGSTVTATVLAALLKNPAFMSALKGLFAGAPDPTLGGLIQGNKPLVGGTGFPDVPIAGTPSHVGMNSGIPGYFQNPDGSLVQIAGDPANGGGYGGGLFPANGSDYVKGGGGDFGPYKD